MLKSSGPAIVLVAALLPYPGAARERLSARDFLADAFGITAADLTRINSGRVVTRTLESTNKREVATLGVTRIKVTPAYYIEQMLDIARFKKSDAVLQIGTFSTPPVLADVAAMTLEDFDIRQLRTCRVGNCGVQLPASAITRFQQTVDWRRADARDQANALMRQILVEYVGAHASSGASASMRYADQSQTVDVRVEIGQLARPEGPGWRHFPALGRHIRDYAGAGASGTTDLIYWSKEKVAARNVVSVTHLAIARTAADSPADYAVASMQIYGTHYFDASLGLTVLVRDSSSETPATYVAYLNRSRIDIFDGFFGGVTRNIVSGKARGTVSDHLGQLQRRLEPQFSALQQR